MKEEAPLKRPVRIAVCLGLGEWHNRFVEALSKKADEGYLIEFRIINLDKSDWLEAIEPFDVVLWKPFFMGPISAGYFKEKIFFMENYLGKLVIPNFKSAWHFESKIAQSYLLKYSAVPTPKTWVTFDYKEAAELVEKMRMPVVMKKSFGASSKNVRIIKRKNKLRNIMIEIFCEQLWVQVRRKVNSAKSAFIRSVFKRWAWAKLRQELLGKEQTGVAYWQEFIPKNNADLRITVLGDRYAYGFWRNNRPDDFRASGSGLIDYDRAVPLDVLRYCMRLSKSLSFDSMAYDVLFTEDGQFVIVEISYAYIDTALYNARGYYKLVENEELVFHEGHTWPQELWVNWLLVRSNAMLGQH